MPIKNHKHLGRKLGIAAIALAAVTAVGMTTAHADQHPRQIHLIEHELVTDNTDVGAPGISPGDVFTFHSEMLDRNYKPVGRADLYAVVTDFKDGDGSLAGTGVIHLRDGMISFASGGFEPEHVLAAITGGTGVYQGVGGQLVVTETDGSPYAAIDITLTH